MSFGVESTDPATLKKSGRRPIPQSHQREILEHCKKKGIVTAAFYVLGFGEDTWNSISATIDYATDIGSTFAQFKILTPYPGTPMFKQLEPLLFESDWEKFDGFSPTFNHPNLTAHEPAVPARRGLQALLHAAVVSRELPEDSEHGHQRVGEPDGPTRERSPFANGDCRHLSHRGMLTAISRYGARVLPETEDIAAGCKARGEFIQGLHVKPVRSLVRTARRRCAEEAVAAAYGRTAFYYILQALDLPPGSEIVLPALENLFWVVPELARVAGLKVVFADVDPATFTMIRTWSNNRSHPPHALSSPRTSTGCPATWTPSWRSPRATTCG